MSGDDAFRRSPEDERLERLRRPASGGRTCLALTIVFGVVFVMCTGAGAAFYFYFLREIEEPVTPADQERVITADRVVGFSQNMRADPARGKLRKVRHLDGTRDLIYEYEGDDNLFVSTTLTEGTSEDGAKGGYQSSLVGVNLGLRIGGDVKQEERNDLWNWGDQSRCIVLRNNNNPVGNLFFARKGKRFFAIMIIGVYFDQVETIKELLDPMLKRLEQDGP